MKKTPLFDAHVALGGKMIPFGGWEMPVQYPPGIIKEHLNTRENGGVFDICHMSEFLIEGDQATDFLQHVMTNDLGLMVDGKGQYACMCYPHGGTIDDCYYYRYSPTKYRLIANASNQEKDWQWLQKHGKQFGVALQNLSDQRGRLSLQGPKAEATLGKIMDKNLATFQRFFFIEGTISGVDAFVARTGYTGEVGFEISFPATGAQNVWDGILAAGKEGNIQPVGLGARDTLRLEAGYSLYGHELNADISPVEAGIGWAVKPKKVPFIGDSVLLAQKASGTTRIIRPVEVVGREIIRTGMEILSSGHEVGHVTSGTYAPSIKKGIGLAIISTDFAGPGTELDVDVRGKSVKIRVKSEPFVKFKGMTK